jgi:hypothetical protein
VGTIVDMVPRSIAAFGYIGDAKESLKQHVVDYTPHRFTSEENYFPVFASNARDLEVLEAEVVTHVTAFYTYMKVMRDYYRRVGDLHPNTENEACAQEWRDTWQNLIYMQFLAYEAARNAVNDLVEYEPTHVENTITILLTEVIAYKFLLAHFERDFRYGRLKLRFEQYEAISKQLEQKVLSHLHDASWDKAIELWNELGERLSKLEILVVKLPDTRHTKRGDEVMTLSSENSN